MKTIESIINNAYKNWHDKDFVFTKIDGKYQGITYGKMIEDANALAEKLAADGLSEKRIMVIGKNSVPYMISDLAVLAFVGTVVNLNFQLGQDEIERVIKKSKIAAVLYDEDQRERFLDIATKFPKLKCYCMQDEVAKLKKPAKMFNFPERNPEACAKIIFTSGTTSSPKGVMLSLKNIFAGWEPLCRRASFGDNEVDYLFLPLHHTYGGIYNFYYSLEGGMQVYLCSDTAKIADELREVRPTIFCAVPLIYRRLMEAYGEHISMAFGDRIRFLFCGGANFSPKIRAFYKQHGLPMFEAYALTETSSSLSIEYPNFDDFESSGTVFENMKVKILNQDKDGVGDIVVKGESVFLGYLDDVKKTKAAFTDDGYFITGDYGWLEGNKLYVRGRKKDVLVGENGENVYLPDIERRLVMACSDVVKLKGRLEKGAIIYDIYLKEASDIDVDQAIQEFNANSAKKDWIINYSVHKESELVGLK